MQYLSRISAPHLNKIACLASFTLCLFLLAPALGCNSAPANPLIGTWTLSADGTAPQVCAGAQQKMTFTDTSSQTWNANGATGGPLMVKYVVQLPNVFISSAGGAVTYTVSGSNIIWYSPYGPCTYSKA